MQQDCNLRYSLQLDPTEMWNELNEAVNMKKSTSVLKMHCMDLNWLEVLQDSVQD